MIPGVAPLAVSEDSALVPVAGAYVADHAMCVNVGTARANAK